MEENKTKQSNRPNLIWESEKVFEILKQYLQIGLDVAVLAVNNVYITHTCRAVQINLDTIQIEN